MILDKKYGWYYVNELLDKNAKLTYSYKLYKNPIPWIDAAYIDVHVNGSKSQINYEDYEILKWESSVLFVDFKFEFYSNVRRVKYYYSPKNYFDKEQLMDIFYDYYNSCFDEKDIMFLSEGDDFNFNIEEKKLLPCDLKTIKRKIIKTKENILVYARTTKKGNYNFLFEF